MSNKKAVPITTKENNKTVIINPSNVELVVVGDHLEFDKQVTEKGVTVGGI